MSAKANDKKRYRLSPLNAGSVLIMIIAIWDQFRPGGGMLLLYLIPAAVAGLVIDLALQFLINDFRWVMWTEIALMILVLLMNSTLVN